MFTVSVRDHIMVAHSFKGDVFGPAQRLHGATFIVDVEFRRLELSRDGIVVDIGQASAALHAVLADLNFQNLDEHPKLKGRNTTTEVLARYVFERMAAAVRHGDVGQHAHGIESMKVTLHESHVASASFEARLVEVPTSD
jgi:6-pyruvoyl-tetrahydropterin synthase